MKKETRDTIVFDVHSCFVFKFNDSGAVEKKDCWHAQAHAAFMVNGRKLNFITADCMRLTITNK